MRTKQVIFLGLTVLLSGSLINMPRLVKADTASSSVSVSSESASSESAAQISSQTSSATKSNASSVMSSSSATTSAASVGPKAEAEPTGTPSDAKTASGNGWSFTADILRRGFSVQPQEEQYAVVGDTSNPINFNGMRVLAGQYVSMFGSPNLVVTRWKWDATSTKWNKDIDAKDIGVTNTAGFDVSSGFYDAANYVPTDLTSAGVYCYQFRLTYGSSEYYSKLAKVVVSPAAVPATAIDTKSVPDVLYADVDYSVSALVTPNNATDKIGWFANSNADVLSFSPGTGRNAVLRAGNGHAETSGNPTASATASTTNYILDNYYVNKVNTDPNSDGIPARFKVSAGSQSQEKSVTVGGLPAFSGSVDVGGSWHLGGLSDLVTATGATNKWHYSWQFTDATGKDVTSTAVTGVTNLSGDATDLTDLDGQTALTFAKDSAFLKQAADATTAGSSYRAQLTVSSMVNQDPDNSLGETPGIPKEVSVVTNKAELQVTPTAGKLTLDRVPSFGFGNLEAATLYDGTGSGTTKQVSDNLQITDNRQTPGWQLSAQMTKMTAGNNDQLAMTTLQMSGIPGEADSIALGDNDTAVALATGAQSGTWPITGGLVLAPNPELQLTANEKFQSTITWTLNSAQPAATKLQ